MQNKEELNKELKEKIDGLVESSVLEAAMENNEFKFDYNDNIYLVRKLTFSEKQKVYQEKVRKYNQLLVDESIPLEKDLKASLKKRGIDLDDMQKQIEELEKKKTDIRMQLGKALEEKSDKEDLEEYKENILDIVEEQQTISLQRGDHLQYCLESQLMVYLYSYAATIVAHVKDGDEWKKVWNSYEEFENEKDEGLINTIFAKAMLMVRNEIQ